MAKRNQPPPEAPRQNTSLLVPRAEAEGKIRERIRLGQEIQSTRFERESQFEEAKAKRIKWDEYNLELLNRLFNPDTIAKEYNDVSVYGVLRVNPTAQQRIESFVSGFQRKLTALESIIERLDLIPEMPSRQAEAPTTRSDAAGKTVFIVHGHDDAAKNSVARFVERFGLEAVILHEQPNKGLTIIEKFEKNASGAGFAIVLLTGDDIGASKDTPETVKPRARQNVILELGYFCGSLGRSKVCVLYKEGVEIPSDYLGVIYTPLDEAGGWHLKLAKEMKEAGLQIDLNKAF